MKFLQGLVQLFIGCTQRLLINAAAHIRLPSPGGNAITIKPNLVIRELQIFMT